MPKRGLEYVWSPRNLLCGSIWGWGWARRTPLVIVNVPAYPLYNINLHSELAALAVIWTAQHRQIRRTDYSSVSQQKDPAIFSGLFIETQQSHSICKPICAAVQLSVPRTPPLPNPNGHECTWGGGASTRDSQVSVSWMWKDVHHKNYINNNSVLRLAHIPYSNKIQIRIQKVLSNWNSVKTKS